MNGNIFINYRRDDSSGSVGRLYDRLVTRFPENQIFIDIDNLAPGVDFVDAIERSLGSCEVLIAVIGRHWLGASDGEGNRRLENPDDFVRLEIGNALKRDIRIIPVLVDGASMPHSRDLPDDLKALARRNAIEVSYTRFRADSERLIIAIERIFETIREAEQREKESREAEQREKEHLEAEGREKESLEAEQREKERLEAEQREKDRLEFERREKERLEAEQREKQRLEVEQRENERLEAEQREKERLEAEQREKQRLEAEQREKQRLEAEQREKERLEAKQRELHEKRRLKAADGWALAKRRPFLIVGSIALRNCAVDYDVAKARPGC